MENNALPPAEHPGLTLLDDWLDVMESNKGGAPSYCHLLIRQKEDVDSAVWDELFVYIDHAHAGARQALRAPLEDSLHPLQHNTEVDPAFGYPHKLGDTALKGFFGEIIAGIVAEYYTGDGEHEWEVPVYLFRTHVVAFQQLEVMKQTDDWERHIVGRTGDDGLAFARDENGRIVAWLACEAKCTGNHSSTLISCPKKNRTWIPTNAPHRDYTGRRNLTCAELHMTGVDEIIRSLYERMDSPS